MIDFTQVRAFKSRPRLRNSYGKKTLSKKEGRIRGYVYLVSRCTLFIITASFLFTNVLFTNIRNDTPHTGLEAMWSLKKILKPIIYMAV